MLLNNRKGLDALLAVYGSSAQALPDIAGLYKGKGLVICADGANAWADLEAFGCRSDLGRGCIAKPGWDFLVVNKLGETFPGAIEHWYSNSTSALGRFMRARRDEYSKEFAPPMHSHSCEIGASWLWPWPAGGTSGLGAVLTGIGLGYEPIVLCGMPLDNGPHNGEPHWRGTKFLTEAPPEDKHWRLAIDKVLKGRVRSMSGRTREWLGDAAPWR